MGDIFMILMFIHWNANQCLDDGLIFKKDQIQHKNIGNEHLDACMDWKKESIKYL